ncbi:uncharacterized protein LOC123272763 [Cotesia glomerata]|uniref:Uncharacterized protein n=1 Tax=Cotesia glomerata TaxID=32391 RepID=A0AAV7IN80_COTGL|nr:uncharacterized protein LOC123272763 [Cotesia glomerata]KAH0564436.1 hypothetical protein KQX54_012065 [Cotesia glomerata]
MCRTLHIFLCGIICLGIFDNGYTAEHPVITPNLLSSLSANVGAILSPNLLKEIQNRASNRTGNKESHESFYNDPTVLPATPTKPKPTRLTSKKPKVAVVPNSQLIKFEETDSLRAPQTQLENQFPFGVRNNFRDFGTGFQGAGRQLSGQFNNQLGQFGQFNGGLGNFDSFNSDIYRPFASLDGSRANDNGAQPQQFAGPVNQNNGANANRQFNYPANPQDFNRFQDFGRFGFNGQFPGNRFFDPSQRQNQYLNFAQDPRALGQNQQNFQDPRVNFQNPDQARLGQGLGQGQGQEQGIGPVNGAFQQQNFANPQNYAPNFNLLQNQRFQSPFNGNFDRNEQEGLNPNFPFFQGRPDGAQAQQIPGNNNGQNINGQINPQINSSRRSEESSQNSQRKNPTQKTTTIIPEVESLQIEKLFYPPVNDYSDVRINSDAFKQHSVGANIVDKNPKTNIV